MPIRRHGPWQCQSLHPTSHSHTFHANTQNLYARMDRMKETLNPAFTDVTWGAGGSTADLSLGESCVGDWSYHLPACRPGPFWIL